MAVPLLVAKLAETCRLRLPRRVTVTMAGPPPPRLSGGDGERRRRVGRAEGHDGAIRDLTEAEVLAGDGGAPGHRHVDGERGAERAATGERDRLVLAQDRGERGRRELDHGR